MSLTFQENMDGGYLHRKQLKKRKNLRELQMTMRTNRMIALITRSKAVVGLPLAACLNSRPTL